MFLPENIDFAFSEKYRLSIRLMPGGFSFCVTCPADRNVFYYKETTFGDKTSYLDNIKKLIFDFSFFTQTFKETNVAVVSHRFTLVPEYFLDKKTAPDFFNFNFQENNGLILDNPLKEMHCRVVYDINEDVYSFLSRNLWNPVFSHHIEALLPYFAKHGNEFEGKRCYVNFHNNLMDICCFDREKLLSANTYIINERFDALYFITGVWEKMPLNQTKDVLFLSGKTDQQHETANTLKKLIRNVEILSFLPKTTIPDTEKTTFPTDLLIQLCE